jgi:hypothetical protein
MSSDNEQWTWAHMAPELSERERQLRNLFVDEYLVDEDKIEAAIRCGFQAAFAEDYALKFLREPYVQGRIKQLKYQRYQNAKSKDEFDRIRVREWLISEARCKFNTGSARVAALAKLANILDMDAPIKTHNINQTTLKAGVMVVPAIASLDSWEAAAVESQTKLVADARS